MYLFYIYIFIFIYFLKYETIVSRNGLSLGYSEQDTCSVYCMSKNPKTSKGYDLEISFSNQKFIIQNS